jgi:tRNA dimethylallyltransferase
MRCVGYRQAWEMLDQAQARQVAPDSLLHVLRELGCTATRQLAKRQLTWLRSMHDRVVLACDATDALAQTVQAAQSFIAADL